MEGRYSNEFFNQQATRIQDYLVEHEVSVPRWRGAHEDEEMAFRAWILRAMQDLRITVDERDRQEVTREVAKRIIGLGVLQPYLEEEGVEEIIVRNGFVSIERDGQIHEVGYLADDAYFYRLARRIAEMEGKGLGGKEPKIKVGLPDGSRFAATIPPISRQGTAINIRRFSLRKLSLEDLVDRGSADQETIDFLAEVASSMKVSVVFAGRPGAGKTTWLNAFSAHIPPHAQVTVVETFQELQPQVEHYHHLVVEEDEEGTTTMADAINTSVLRMRPDVLMIGEVVSREAYQYIMALNLGIVSHTTTHAQSARMALARLENLARRDMEVSELRPVIGYGLGLVIHLGKDYDPARRQYVRRMNEIIAIRGYENGEYVIRPLKVRQGDTFTPLAAGMELFL
ncbi:MAG: CpaF family protein [Chloroflexi bacterium]|nr:CpaF family protein [Chloroflexota bacterium]